MLLHLENFFVFAADKQSNMTISADKSAINDNVMILSIWFNKNQAYVFICSTSKGLRFNLFSIFADLVFPN